MDNEKKIMSNGCNIFDACMPINIGELIDNAFEHTTLKSLIRPTDSCVPPFPKFHIIEFSERNSLMILD